MKKLLFLLLFPSVCLAVSDQTIYVNASCANNGDGTTSSCAASNGAAGAFNDLKSAVDTKATNLITADKRHIYEIEGNVADSISDPIDLSGYGTGTSSTQYPLFRTSGSYRHSGYWDTGKPTLSCAGYEGCFVANAKFVTINGLQIKSTRQTDGPGAGVLINSAANDSGTITVINNIIRYDCSSGCTGSSQNAGIMVKNDNSNDSVTVIAANNVIYNFQQSGIKSDFSDGDSWKLVFYNNTLVSNGVNNFYFTLYGTNDTVVLRDNITNGATSDTDFYIESSASTYTHAKNISSDTSSPDTSYRSLTTSFAGASDYRLADTDATALDEGDDLSADSDYSFSTDAAGVSRPQGPAWDIGALEGSVASGGGGVPPIILLGDY